VSQRVALADVEPQYFKYVARWLYSQRLEPEAAFFKDGKPMYFLLLELYALADRLALEGLRNGVVDLVGKLAHDTNSVPTPSDTHILYECIRDNTPIRALVLDLFLQGDDEVCHVMISFRLGFIVCVNSDCLFLPFFGFLAGLPAPSKLWW
jgi:hypothetical protein